MIYSKPGDAGVCSERIIEYLERLEGYNLSTHNLILARDDKIFFEQYWKPFDKTFLHRMYSVSKSFVSLAIGFLEQDGLISLNDRIEKYFAEELKKQADDNMKRQTIRDMLLMRTAKTGRNWFAGKSADRVRFYFENDTPYSRKPGILFQYDSTGLFVLGALVERITKMQLMDYLRIKLFEKIGLSKGAYCLKCPGGHSWSDSAILCTPLDLLKTARFVMNEGKWNGEQILSAEYIRKATGKQIDNNPLGQNDYHTQGYGYQFWRTYDNSFFFNGMGCQLAVCVPDKDMIMIYNGDNQGNDLAKEIIIKSFFDMIVNPAADMPIEDNDKPLREYAAGLELASAKGEEYSEFAERINGRIYSLENNPMGIEKVSLSFEGETGKLKYTNTQGDKEIIFGMRKNVYGSFPQEGYSDNVGTEYVPGNFYKCAVSAAWTEPQKLFLKVQIIDKYFGNLNITLGFDGDEIAIEMKKTAEDFLQEYQGFATGRGL